MLKTVFNCENTGHCQRLLSYFRSWENKPYALKHCGHVLCYYCATSQTLDSCPKCKQTADSIFCLNRPKLEVGKELVRDLGRESLFGKRGSKFKSQEKQNKEEMCGVLGEVEGNGKKEKVAKVIQEFTQSLADLEGLSEKTDEEDFLENFISSLACVTKKLQKVQKGGAFGSKIGKNSLKFKENKSNFESNFFRKLEAQKNHQNMLQNEKEKSPEALNVDKTTKIFKSQVLKSNLKKFEHKNQKNGSTFLENPKNMFSLKYRPIQNDISFSPEVYKKKYNFSTYFTQNEPEISAKKLKKIKENPKKSTKMSFSLFEPKNSNLEKNLSDLKFWVKKHDKFVSEIKEKSTNSGKTLIKPQFDDKKLKRENYFRQKKIRKNSKFGQIKKSENGKKILKKPKWEGLQPKKSFWTPNSFDEISNKLDQLDNKFCYVKTKFGENNFFDYPGYSFVPQTKKPELFSNYFLNEPFLYKKSENFSKKNELKCGSNYMFTRPAKKRDCFCCFENYQWPIRPSSEQGLGFQPGETLKSRPIDYQIETNFFRNKKRTPDFAAKKNNQISDMPCFWARKQRSPFKVVKTEDMQYPRMRLGKRRGRPLAVSDCQMQLFLRKRAENRQAQCEVNDHKLDHIGDSLALVLSTLNLMKVQNQMSFDTLDDKLAKMNTEIKTIKSSPQKPKNSVKTCTNLGKFMKNEPLKERQGVNLSGTGISRTNGINGSNELFSQQWTHWTRNDNGTKGAFGGNNVVNCEDEKVISSGESILNNKKEVDDLDDLKIRLTRIQRKNLKNDLKNITGESEKAEKEAVSSLDQFIKKGGFTQKIQKFEELGKLKNKNCTKEQENRLKSCKEKIEEIMKNKSSDVMKKLPKGDSTIMNLSRVSKSPEISRFCTKKDHKMCFALKNDKYKMNNQPKKNEPQNEKYKIKNLEPIIRIQENGSMTQSMKLKEKLTKEFNFLEKYFSNRIKKVSRDPSPVPKKKEPTLSQQFARKIKKISGKISPNKAKFKETQDQYEGIKIEIKKQKNLKKNSQYCFLKNFHAKKIGSIQNEKNSPTKMKMECSLFKMNNLKYRMDENKLMTDQSQISETEEILIKDFNSLNVESVEPEKKEKSLSEIIESLEQKPIMANFKKLLNLKKISKQGTKRPLQAFNMENFSKSLQKFDANYSKEHTQNTERNSPDKLQENLSSLQKELVQKVNMEVLNKSNMISLLSQDQQDPIKIDFDLDIQKSEKIMVLEDAQDPKSEKTETFNSIELLNSENSKYSENLQIKSGTFQLAEEILPREMEVIEFNSNSIPKSQNSSKNKLPSFDSSGLLNVWKLDTNTQYVQNRSKESSVCKATQTHNQEVREGDLGSEENVPRPKEVLQDRTESAQKYSSHWESLICEKKSKEEHPVKSELKVNAVELEKSSLIGAKPASRATVFEQMDQELVSLQNMINRVCHQKMERGLLDVSSDSLKKETLFSQKKEILSACSNETPVPQKLDNFLDINLEPYTEPREREPRVLLRPSTYKSLIPGLNHDNSDVQTLSNADLNTRSDTSIISVHYNSNERTMILFEETDKEEEVQALPPVTKVEKPEPLHFITWGFDLPQKEIKASSGGFDLNIGLQDLKAMTNLFEDSHNAKCPSKEEFEENQNPKSANDAKEQVSKQELYDYKLSQICELSQDEVLNPFSNKSIKKNSMEFESLNKESIQLDSLNDENVSLLRSKSDKTLDDYEVTSLVDLLPKSKVEKTDSELDNNRLEFGLSNSIDIQEILENFKSNRSHVIDEKLKVLSEDLRNSTNEEESHSTKEPVNKIFRTKMEQCTKRNTFQPLIGSSEPLQMEKLEPLPPWKIPLLKEIKIDSKMKCSELFSKKNRKNKRLRSPILKKWFVSDYYDTDQDVQDQDFLFDNSNEENKSGIGSSIMSNASSLMEPKVRREFSERDELSIFSSQNSEIVENSSRTPLLKFMDTKGKWSY